MATLLTLLTLTALLAAEPLGPGNHNRSLTVDERQRHYLVHIPAQYDAGKPTPVVLVLHGAATNGAITIVFTGMNRKSDEAGFIVVYPNGTGSNPFLTWNAGLFTGAKAADRADDVKYIGKVLDDLSTVVNVDAKRVFATGMSNGGMMCYRLAAEMSDRIAAIAPVAGTMAIDEAKPVRAVPVLHFHGTEDRLVPPPGPRTGTPKFVTFKPLEETIRIWREIDGCPATAVVTDYADKENDGTTVQRQAYGPGTDGAEVVLILIAGGGHTWPGQPGRLRMLGNSTLDISANDLIWEFFQKHPLK